MTVTEARTSRDSVVLPHAPEVTPDVAPGLDRSPERRRRAEWLGAGLWLGLVVVALVWGTASIAGPDINLRAAPLYGRWNWHPGLGLVPAALMGGVAVMWGPAVAARARWRTVAVLSGLWASGWTLTLAASDGWSRITEPLTTRHEYEPLAAGVGDLGPFLDSYVERLGEYPIHVQGHPPGPVVVAWSLDRLGFGGAGWLAALTLALWGVAAAAALVAARAVAGEAAARRAAPALAILPAAVWAGTSVDALFAGIVAIAVALAALAATQDRRRPRNPDSAQVSRYRFGFGRRGFEAESVAIGRSAAYALGSGVMVGVALLLSYGVVPLLLAGAVVVVVVGRRPLRLLAGVAVGLMIPLALAAVAGFWWLDGLTATREAYWAGVGAQRPAFYLTLVGNPAALALAVGPAVAVGLSAVFADFAPSTPSNRPAAAPSSVVRSSKRSRSPAVVGLLPVVVLAAVVLADLSQMSRGEVERIWLPFVPWLALAAPGDRRAWLGAQVGVALIVQAWLVSAW